MEEEFQPSILVFCCNWCSYAGADLAGVSRLQYPVNVKLLRVMCSGRVDPYFILRALELGADGVLITGCEIGDCHYISGNVKAKERIERLSKLLDQIGIGSERIRLEWIAASEGVKFAQVMEDFTDHITNLGPNPLKGGETGGG
ncbi:MAG: hydrogenase iron-sulfur subunit [Thermoplasmata archaeon]